MFSPLPPGLSSVHDQKREVWVGGGKRRDETQDSRLETGVEMGDGTGDRRST